MPEIMIISKLLKDLGIPASLSGYSYLRYAIILMSKDMNLKTSICSELYPQVATEFNASPSRVERCMRHAIETGWLRGNRNVQAELFGYSVDLNTGKPTNGEFIVTVADYLNLIKQEVAQDVE